MCDKDTRLALLHQLTSHWKLITDVYYDNSSPRADVKGLCIGSLQWSPVDSLALKELSLLEMG